MALNFFIKIFIYLGHEKVAELLTRNGSKVNAEDTLKRTPLHYAANGKLN